MSWTADQMARLMILVHKLGEGYSPSNQQMRREVRALFDDELEDGPCVVARPSVEV